MSRVIWTATVKPLDARTPTKGGDHHEGDWRYRILRVQRLPDGRYRLTLR
ncbi:hypothetical protein [Deinococcus apachensis]|nr:hypothetical protein [Deinococcus apachensis]